MSEISFRFALGAWESTRREQWRRLCESKREGHSDSCYRESKMKDLMASNGYIIDPQSSICLVSLFSLSGGELLYTRD